MVDFRKSNLKICAVSKVTISANGASHSATKVSLTREGLLDGLHSEVGVSAVRHFPVSDLGGSGKEYVLCAIGDQLHQCSSHSCVFIDFPEKLFFP